MTKESPQLSQAWPAGVARNAPCPCGSGQKYKRCCGAQSEAAAGSDKASGDKNPSSNSAAAQVQFKRGLQLLQSGNIAAAMPVLLQAMELDRNHFEAHRALGWALLRSGRFGDAGVILSRAVALRPDSAPAWKDLGTARDRQNLHPQAIEAYRKAVELAPKQGDVLVRLAELYTMYSRADEAADCLERAADLDPDSTNARLYRSDACLLRGEVPGAEEWARKAVALGPESGAAHGALAGLLYSQGRFEEAATSFETALRLDPKAGRCWYGLTDCRTFSRDDTSILDRMNGVLQRKDLNEVDRMRIHFAMGKVYDDCGDFSHAMEQFDAANGLRSQGLAFDRAQFKAMVDRTIERFTREFIEAEATQGNPDPQPLFIVGMYRSGTTLVEQILSSHPDIAAGGELTVWSPTDIEVDPRTGEFDRDRTRAAIARYLSVLKKIGPSATHVTDKLPFNCLRLGAIHALMPNAKIIHCSRDPIDTCLSIYANLFNSRVPFAARKADLVFCYRQYQRIMDHWRKVLPARVFTDVQYEQLIADRETETRRLVAFAGLDWNDSCLRPEENRRAVGTASSRQVRQSVYTTSLRRWRHYEPWLGELRQLLPLETGNEA